MLLVDVGCGTCFYFPILSRHAENLVGVDVCIPMLEQAKELIQVKGLENCRVEDMFVRGGVIDPYTKPKKPTGSEV